MFQEKLETSFKNTSILLQKKSLILLLKPLKKIRHSLILDYLSFLKSKKLKKKKQKNQHKKNLQDERNQVFIALGF